MLSPKEAASRVTASSTPRKQAFRTRAPWLDPHSIHSNSIQADTLLLHGKYDDRASVDQAEGFSKAVAQAGVPVRLHTLEGGHRLVNRSRPFFGTS
ncbi:prolyl oligopeptidase family serine peptidase [Rhizobium leguminosarum]|uniref:alpha/beta hydrolase family protein n=1 Tax=Rhizobium leguminosarum TaxID=384 RepID=UPI001C93FFF8|nr:prolyl oligopeptidase family serine peptidase [Rhizobium leguminosarum]